MDLLLHLAPIFNFNIFTLIYMGVFIKQFKIRLERSHEPCAERRYWTSSRESLKITPDFSYSDNIYFPPFIPNFNTSTAVFTAFERFASVNPKIVWQIKRLESCLCLSLSETECINSAVLKIILLEQVIFCSSAICGV